MLSRTNFNLPNPTQNPIRTVHVHYCLSCGDICGSNQDQLLFSWTKVGNDEFCGKMICRERAAQASRPLPNGSNHRLRCVG